MTREDKLTHEQDTLRREKEQPQMQLQTQTQEGIDG